MECAYLLKSGKLPPFNWLPDIAGGRGGPNYSYYGSLGFLGPAYLVNLGMEPEAAIRFWTGFVIIVGFMSAWLFFSTFGGRLGGLAAATLFIYGPYYFSLPFSRGGYPEHLAYSIYPLLFYFAGKMRWVYPYTSIICTSAVLFIIVAVHTLSLAVIIPPLVFYTVAVGKLRFTVRLAACTSVLCLSSILLAPCLVGPVLERGKVVLSEQLASTEAAKTYAASGVPWYSMLTRDFLDDIVSRSVPGRVHVIAVLLTVIVALSTNDLSTRRNMVLQLVVALCALVLVERTISGILASLIPRIAYLQFPWRLLAIFNLFASAGFSACLSKTSPIPFAGKFILAAGIPVLCVLVYFRHIPAQEPWYLPTRTREGLRASMSTLDHESKYMPIGAKLFNRPAPKVLLEVPDGECFELEILPNDYHYRVLSRSAQTLTFHQYFFPGWTAAVDGVPCTLRSDQSGLCQLEISEGHHEIRFHFVRTLIHTVALSVSLLGWAGLAIFVCLTAWIRLRRRPV